MPYRKRRNTDEESTKRNYWQLTGKWVNIVKKLMRKMKFCKDDGYICSK